jgi:hypothetical protein
MFCTNNSVSTYVGDSIILIDVQKKKSITYFVDQKWQQVQKIPVFYDVSNKICVGVQTCTDWQKYFVQNHKHKKKFKKLIVIY